MKRWELSRRTVLRGLGTAVALPVLEAMLPGLARAQAMGRPRRLVAFYVACGMYMQRWTPSATGTGYPLSPILQPLGAYNGLPSIQGDVLVLTGLANRPARPDGPGDHASGTGAFITAAHPFKTNGANISNGISMDQVLANHLRGQTKFASLELGIDGGAPAETVTPATRARTRATSPGPAPPSRWPRRPTRKPCSTDSLPVRTRRRRRRRWRSASGSSRACWTP